MDITGFLFDKQKAEYFDRFVEILVSVSNMDLKEKEQLLGAIPKDYKLDNDMTIVKYLIWTGIREELIKIGYLTKSEDKGQIKLDVV